MQHNAIYAASALVLHLILHGGLLQLYLHFAGVVTQLCIEVLDALKRSQKPLEMVQIFKLAECSDAVAC